MSSSQPRSFEFGSYRLDVGERLLRYGPEVLPLTPKAFDTLALLVRRAGHVVTKDELIQALRPDAHVEENNLVQYISLLRRVLKDGTNGGAYIETVPKVGYRFIADVRQLETEPELVPPGQSTRSRIVWQAAIAALVVAALAASYLPIRTPGRERKPRPNRLRRARWRSCLCAISNRTRARTFSVSP